MKRWGLYTVLLVVVWLLWMVPVSAQTDSYECTIDLLKNRTTCDSAWIVFLDGPENGQALVQITLAPESGFSRAAFNISYGEAIQGWTLNIGDSISNNGFRGDASNQTNDAELQIVGANLSVYGRDGIPENLGRILHLTDLVTPGTFLQIEIADQSLAWTANERQTSTLLSEYLYALNGQADEEGPVNYTVYAAFNRVILGQSDRTGTGVQRVIIRLLSPAE